MVGDPDGDWKQSEVAIAGYSERQEGSDADDEMDDEAPAVSELMSSKSKVPT